MKSPSSRLTVFLIVLLDVMGFGLIIPSQPFLAKHFGATATTVTLLGTTYSLMQFLLAPVWGTLSDRLGRRPILLCTILMTAFGHATFAAATSLSMLFLARALAGTGAANISTAQAVLADTHPPHERSRAMALVGVAFGLGFVFGPALGSMLFKFDHRAPATFGAILAALNFIFVFISLPETRSREGQSARYSPSVSDIFAVDPALRPLVFITLLFITAFALMEQSVGLFIEQVWVAASSTNHMERATNLTGNFLVVVGLAAILSQGLLVRKLLKTTPELRLVNAGLLTVGGSLALIPILGAFGNYPLFLISGATLALGSGLFNPSMAGLISLTTPGERQGYGLAVNQSAAALGRILGPTSAGWLFSKSSSLPFIVGVVLVTAAVLLCQRVPSRPRN